MDNITINQTDKTNNNPKKRIEKDKLGTVSIDKDLLYGIQTARAFENFNISNSKVRKELIYAMVTVKKAAAMANEKVKTLDSGDMRYEYSLEAYDKNGKSTTVTFKTSRELRDDAYLKLDVMISVV